MSKAKVTADLGSGERPLPGLHTAVASSSHKAETGVEVGLASSSSPKITNLRGCSFNTSSKPNYLQKLPSPNTITLRIRSLACEIFGHKRSVHSSPVLFLQSLDFPDFRLLMQET